MKRVLAMIAIVLLAGMVPVTVCAAELNPICKDGGLTPEQREAAGCDNTGDELIGGENSRIPGIISAVLWIAGLLAVGMIIYSGVRMVISQGDAGKLEQEKKTITYAVAGLVVVLISYIIVAFLVGAFGGGAADGSGDGEEEEAPATVMIGGRA